MGTDLAGQVWAPLLLLMIAMAFLALGTLWLLGVRTHNRQRRWAIMHGLRYHEHDPGLPYIRFHHGGELTTNRVITGSYRGATVFALQNDRTPSGELPTRIAETRIAVVTPASTPVLELEARSNARTTGSVLNGLGHTAVNGIPTGEPAFDERFVVLCDDPRFVRLLLTRELTDWLLRQAEARGFWRCRFVDGLIAVDSARELEKVDIIARFNFLVDLRRRVDPAVWDYDRRTRHQVP